MDVKGIGVFLGTVFVLGYAAQFLALGLGVIDLRHPSFVQTVVAGVLMYIPALAVLVASQAAPNRAMRLPKSWPLPTAAGLRVVAAVPVVFALFYALTALVGLSEAQWGMGVLVNELDRMTSQLHVAALTPEVKSMVPAVALTAGTLMSVMLGATLFTAMMWGSEVGWRGYLLPRLLPLGRVWAYVIVGVVSAWWFAPVVYAWYGGIADPQFWVFMLRLAGFGIAFGAFLGELLRGANHLGLVALAAGGFVGQCLGIWEFLFQLPTAPWCGPFGIVSIAAWIAAAFFAAPLARGGDSRPGEGERPREPKVSV